MHIYIPQRVLRILAILVLFVAFSGYSFLKADWSPAPTLPPGNNIDAPVNVGTLPQVKNGGLGVNTLAVYGAFTR
jgi:hypothetical protein